MDDISLLHDIADEADHLTMQRFQSRDLRVSQKPDMTLVSDADQATEQRIRELVTKYRPNDGFIGEEFAAVTGTERTWIVDPIDGTHNYVRGVPVWATLLAIQEGTDVIAGMVSAPALGRRWWAQRGNGAFTRTLLSASKTPEITRLHVSQVAKLSDASLSYSSLHGWKDIQRGNAFANLMSSVWRTRAYGDFWSYMMVAEGVVDIAAEPELELYDMAALVPIILEAGGKFTSVSGRESGPHGPNAVASNGLVHDEVLRQLSAAD